MKGGNSSVAHANDNSIVVSIYNGMKTYTLAISHFTARFAATRVVEGKDLLNRHIKITHSKKSGKETTHPAGSPGHGQPFSNCQQLPEPLPLYSLPGPEMAAAPTLEMSNDMATLDQPQGMPQLPQCASAESSVSTNLLQEPFLNSQPDSRPFTFNYLDNVCLPPLFDPAAFYPGLSINDPLLSPIFGIDGNTSEQATLTDGRIRERPDVSASLPQVESERQHLGNPSFLRMSQDDWQWLSAQISQFHSNIPTWFQLPSRHAISRYMHGFMTGFHPHFPIIHPQTLVLKEMAPELILALAAVGSHYCLEPHQGMKIFPVAKAIALEQLRRRDAERDEATYASPVSSWTSPKSQPQSISRDRENTTEHQSTHADTETMQALFFLMAMATWGGEHRSLALYHLAHIRLAIDIGPARSLLEQPPNQIATQLQEGPRIERGPSLLLAARHATAALCSPVQMGVYFVGRAPSWSVMHAVCSLEYAYILNQFIQAVIQVPAQCLEEDERDLFDTIKETLCEVEMSSSIGNPRIIETEPKIVGPKAVRAWAIILDGMRTWNAVCVITRTLFLYADLLERNAFFSEGQA
ncbi:hypothetical protein PISL3812_06116 [Talaromyces islandicus]|uniref:Transcription factor domain-containing protein n=1 Tax=Talaromyces islandicus TaxID=28573 RepID=A0A0U1M284_TALIS|nr:hypothetical protein PISL3812_06116 [Talaromyces islandicus]